ncbi:MAG: metal ABC transporter permease [Bernardetiaceae bacterium]|nr:metal ABC transporter permease [Bernardetiaceae bacterium]
MNTFWIIFAGSLVAIISAILGSFMMLRRQAMIIDAISHAVLPGIFAAYWFSSSFQSWQMWLGASLTGLFSTFLIAFLQQKLRLQSDAAIGISFTLLFSIGVILISAFSADIDLDTDCVLYGELAYVPLDISDFTFWGIEVPRIIWTLLALLIAVLLLIVVFYKQFKITTFDPEFASAIGISNNFWHYVLMAAVSLTTVTAFEAVGAILVVAFMIVPSAAAFLLTRRLSSLLLLAACIGVLSVQAGYWAAWLTDGAVAAAMASASGLFLLIAFIFRRR